MLKHSDCLSTLDQELFPGLREEKDRKRWLWRKWAFAIFLGMWLAFWSGALWETGRQQIKTIAGNSFLHNAVENQFVARANQGSWLDELHTGISHTVKASMMIPKGTLIPVKIESTQSRGLGQTRIVARTKSYVFRDKTVLIPAGSQIEGMAHQHAGKWEIHWHSVSVVSAEGREADIQAMNEIPGRATLHGRSLLVRAN